MDRTLTNEDLAPVPQSHRNWSTIHFLSLWVGMAVCIPSYMIAASLIDGGMSWGQAIATVFLGNAIVLVPMILNGHVGAKYGIPFPIFARASFGVKGSNLPALLRALVACGWFGIQSWIGGAAINAMINVVWPGFATLPNIDLLGVGLAPFICFLIFWGINIWLIWKGVDSIKMLETLSAPFLIASGLALLAWGYSAAGGFGEMLQAPSKFQTSSEFWNFFLPGLTGMVGFWATLSLNIPDFTRYAKDQKSQVWGQALGLPTTMTLFAFIGVAVTSATITVFGSAIWDPIVLVGKFNNPLIVFIAMFAVVIATLSTNVAANVVGPANDFSNMFPTKVNFKIGGYITGIIGILILPWKLVADPSGYIFTWLIGYSALLGPIGGILLVDYYLIRKCELKVDDLYSSQGAYWYGGGTNWLAVIAMICGVAPNIPGFLAQIKAIDSVPENLHTIYHYAWFNSLIISGLVYYFLMKGKKNGKS